MVSSKEFVFGTGVLASKRGSDVILHAGRNLVERLKGKSKWECVTLVPRELKKREKIRHYQKTFSGVFKRRLVLFFLNNFSRFFYFSYIFIVLCYS